MTLAEAVRSGRNARTPRIKQFELAAMLKVTRQTIIAIENGKDTSWKMAKQLSQILGFSLDSITL